MPGRQRARRRGGRRKDIGAKVREKDDAEKSVLLTRLAPKREKPGSSSRPPSRVSFFVLPPCHPATSVSFVYRNGRLSFVSSVSTSGFPLPRDRRNPLPSFHDDIKRVLMSVQLWRLASIKAHAILPFRLRVFLALASNVLRVTSETFIGMMIEERGKSRRESIRV